MPASMTTDSALLEFHLRVDSSPRRIVEGEALSSIEGAGATAGGGAGTASGSGSGGATGGAFFLHPTPTRRVMHKSIAIQE
jgi:hypothetical protein